MYHSGAARVCKRVDTDAPFERSLQVGAMVKAYLRYELASSFGVVASNSNVVHDHSGKLIVAASLENIAIWNVKQGTLVCAVDRGSADMQHRPFLSTANRHKPNCCCLLPAGQNSDHSS